jgi:hypothetical protein
MDAGTLIALIVGVIGIAITIVIWVASTRAVNTQRSQESQSPAYFRTVDEAAIERASRVYERTIDDLETEITTRRHHEAEQNQEIIKLNKELSKARRRAGIEDEDSGPMVRLD